MRKRGRVVRVPRDRRRILFSISRLPGGREPALARRRSSLSQALFVPTHPSDVTPVRRYLRLLDVSRGSGDDAVAGQFGARGRAAGSLRVERRTEEVCIALRRRVRAASSRRNHQQARPDAAQRRHRRQNRDIAELKVPRDILRSIRRHARLSCRVYAQVSSSGWHQHARGAARDSREFCGFMSRFNVRSAYGRRVRSLGHVLVQRRNRCGRQQARSALGKVRRRAWTIAADLKQQPA